MSKALDRETLSHHVLKVTAYERLNPSIFASTTVFVDLLDVQDNSPVFEKNSYFSEIREDAPVYYLLKDPFFKNLNIYIFFGFSTSS